jgi:hypothetical protein
VVALHETLVAVELETLMMAFVEFPAQVGKTPVAVAVVADKETMIVTTVKLVMAVLVL